MGKGEGEGRREGRGAKRGGGGAYVGICEGEGDEREEDEGEEGGDVHFGWGWMKLRDGGRLKSSCWFEWMDIDGIFEERNELVGWTLCRCPRIALIV